MKNSAGWWRLYSILNNFYISWKKCLQKLDNSYVRVYKKFVEKQIILVQLGQFEFIQSHLKVSWPIAGTKNQMCNMHLPLTISRNACDKSACLLGNNNLINWFWNYNYSPQQSIFLRCYSQLLWSISGSDSRDRT